MEAPELEKDLLAATAENEQNHAKFKAVKDKQSASTQARLALAEETTQAMNVHAAAGPRRHSQLSLPGLGNDSPISDEALSLGSAQLDNVQESFDALAGLRRLLLRAHATAVGVQDLEVAGVRAEASVRTLPVASAVRRQPWSGSAFSTSIGNLPRSAYSSTSPHKKASSNVSPRRCSSVPTTPRELEPKKDAVRDLQHDPETSIVDPSGGCAPKSKRLLSLQANHMHNRSLRHVSDTTNFWRLFARKKFNEALGFEGYAM